MTLVSLTTDFGTRDPYAAAMKGVLLEGCPDARIVDLTHEIGPHDVLEGALFLAAAVPYFPAGTIHVAVVDPGVGTGRRGLVAATAGQLVVCPDNGLLTLLARRYEVTARAIENRALFRTPVSPTFHGRDVFAPVAAYLACGGDVSKVGPPIEDLVRLPLPEPARSGGVVRGEVIHIDHFGNAVTNIDAPAFDALDRPLAVAAGGRELGHLKLTYGDVPAGDALALIGSAGLLEVAVREASAADRLGLRLGDAVEVRPAPGR